MRCRRVLGDGQPDTLASARNLAWTPARLGRTYEAHRLEQWVKRHTPPGGDAKQ